jgi:Zn-dependent M16 (insulinase) family peptidase
MDFLLSARVDERKRIQEILEKHHTDLENSLSSNALEYAINRNNASISMPLAISELWYGLSYVQNIRQLVLAYPEREQSFLRKLESLKNTLLLTQNLHLIACGDNKNLMIAKENRFWGLLDVPITPAHPWICKVSALPAENLGFVIPSTVSYSASTIQTVPYTHPDAPTLAIIAQLLNNTILHKKLREQGGAYGGGASANPIAGTFTFYSYRDPNLYSTIKTFETSPQALSTNPFTDQEIAEAKLSVLQDLDTPIAPGSRAILAYSWWRKGKSHVIRQQFRDRLIAVCRNDILKTIHTYFPPVSKPFVAFANQQLFAKDAAVFAGENRPLTILQT